MFQPGKPPTGSKILSLAAPHVTTLPSPKMAAKAVSAALICCTFWSKCSTWAIIPSGHQTWLAGKCPMNGGFIGKITDLYSSFSIAMFDNRRITSADDLLLSDQSTLFWFIMPFHIPWNYASWCSMEWSPIIQVGSSVLHDLLITNQSE